MSGRSKWHKYLTSLKIYLKKHVRKVQHMALTAVIFLDPDISKLCPTLAAQLTLHREFD